MVGPMDTIRQPRVLVVVLAAGQARRFGGNKLEQPCAGQPLGLWALQAAAATGHPVVVVSAVPQPGFAAGWQDRSEICVNPDAQAGLGGSIRIAAQAAQAQGADILVTMLADMPLVTPALIASLAATCTPQSASACLYPGMVPGIPAAWGCALFPQLAAIDPASGGRPLLRQVAGLVTHAADPAMLLDVDVPADLHQAERALLMRTE